MGQVGRANLNTLFYGGLSNFWLSKGEGAGVSELQL
jgi:hypothetical protein